MLALNQSPWGVDMRSLLFCASLLVVLSVHSAERVELYDSTLADLIEWTAEKLGKSLIVGADIRSAPLSVVASYSGPAELEDLLRNSVLSSGLHWSSDDRTIRISSEPIAEPAELFTEVIRLQHLQSDFAYEAVRDVLATRAAAEAAPVQVMVSPSPTSNAVIVTATAAHLGVVRRVVEEIDRPRRQVVITAVVAELSDDDYQALGLNLGADSGRSSVDLLTVRASDRSDLGLALTFNGPTLSAFVQAVKSTGRNRILSTPQLLTLNRESASIVVGQNVPFLTGSTTSASTPASDPYQTISRQDVGVTLDVTPYITPSGSIELRVIQSASSVSDDRTAADIITNTRRISTRVQLQDGGGLLLGGLRQEQTDSSVSRIPLLGDIPYLGALFRSTTSRTRATNLVVLLSARIHGEADHRAFADPIESLVLPHLDLAGAGFGAAGARPSEVGVVSGDVPVARQ